MTELTAEGPHIARTRNAVVHFVSSRVKYDE